MSATVPFSFRAPPAASASSLRRALGLSEARMARTRASLEAQGLLREGPQKAAAAKKTAARSSGKRVAPAAKASRVARPQR